MGNHHEVMAGPVTMWVITLILLYAIGNVYHAKDRMIEMGDGASRDDGSCWQAREITL
jgi:hypothetical protein